MIFEESFFIDFIVAGLILIDNANTNLLAFLAMD